MAGKLKVMCVLDTDAWHPTSGRPKQYTPEHVIKLRDMVERWSGNVDYDFICLTNEEIDGVDCRKFEHNNWPGWWHKIELFKYKGPVLYFDLDTIICGDISDIMRYETDFMGLDNIGMPGSLGSGVMKWGGDLSYVYDKYKVNARFYQFEYTNPRKWGDQGFIEDTYRGKFELFQSVFPRAILSYRLDLASGSKTKPQSAKIIYFHGKDKPEYAADHIKRLYG